MLHGCFASGRYTSTVLFVLSLLVMLSAAWLPASVASVAQPAVPAFLGAFLSRAISALIYILAAVLLSRQAFFDRGVKWLGALYLWFVAVCTFVNGNPVIAFAALLFLISIILCSILSTMALKVFANVSNSSKNICFSSDDIRFE